MESIRCPFWEHDALQTVPRSTFVVLKLFILLIKLGLESHFQASLKIMQLENAFSPFRPFYITSIYGLGKAANPPDISVVGVYDFTKFRIPPPISFELKTMSRIFPLPRGREANSTPCIPQHISLVGPGSYPRGKPMTCALRRSENLHSHQTSPFLR